MSKIFLTSDLHFNHPNILKYEAESRPFNTIEEMNETLIQNWNKVVSEVDDVFVLGDFFMGTIEGIEPILTRLNGKIHLIRGNHDTKNRLEYFKEKGIDIHDIYYLPYKGRYFILCHFPIASKEFINLVIKDNSEVVCCYGHIHSNAEKGYVNGTYHVGVDTNELTPIDLEQLYKECWPESTMTPEIIKYKEEHEKSNE